MSMTTDPFLTRSATFTITPTRETDRQRHMVDHGADLAAARRDDVGAEGDWLDRREARRVPGVRRDVPT